MLALLIALIVPEAHATCGTAYDPATGFTSHGAASGYVVFGYIDPTPALPLNNDEYAVSCAWNGGSTANPANYQLVSYPMCGRSTPSNYPLGISDAGGAGQATTIGPVTRVGGVLCADAAGTPVTILPFPSFFSFGLWFTGYGEGDTAYGTKNDDILWASRFSALPTVPAGTMSTQSDLLCGYDGDDILVSSNGTYYGVCMDGGNDTDDCTVTTDDARDAVLSCETVTNNPMDFPITTCDCGTLASDSFFKPYKP